MPYCPECGTENPDENRFCIECGTKLPKVSVGGKIEAEEKPHQEVKPAAKKKGGRWKVVVVLIILVIIVFIGYTYYSENSALDGIQVSVSGAGTPSIGLYSATFPITLSFYNSSNNSSPPFTVTYEIFVNGSGVATGSASVEAISPGSTQTSDFTVYFSYYKDGSAIWSVVSSGHFYAIISGQLEARAVFGLIPITKSFSTNYSV